MHNSENDVLDSGVSLVIPHERTLSRGKIKVTLLLTLSHSTCPLLSDPDHSGLRHPSLISGSLTKCFQKSQILLMHLFEVSHYDWTFKKSVLFVLCLSCLHKT